MVHQILLLNCLDHTGMEYVLPYSFVNPFISSHYIIVYNSTMGHFACMQNSTEVLCEVFTVVT